MIMLVSLHELVKKERNSEKAKLLGRFFKTGKGEYAEGDVFYGLTVPQSRKIVAQYRELPLPDCIQLLHSTIHEERLIALLILVYQFQKGDEKIRKKMYDAYLANTKYINNWDLVDLSAPQIIGEYLLANGKGRMAYGKKKENRDGILEKLARSKNLWERRIAMIATFAFIRQGEYTTTFTIADILLHDTHDLIHKAVGWMLREVGKRVSEKQLQEFLLPRYKTMPRTSLRYAIERFPEKMRKLYLAGKIA